MSSRAGQAVRLAVGPPQRHAAVADPAIGAVPVPHAILEHKMIGPARHDAVERGMPGGEVVGMHALLRFAGLIGKLRLVIAEHVAELRRVPDLIGLEVPVPQAVLRPEHRQLETLLAPAQLLRGGLRSVTSHEIPWMPLTLPPASRTAVFSVCR